MKESPANSAKFVSLVLILPLLSLIQHFFIIFLRFPQFFSDQLRPKLSQIDLQVSESHISFYGRTLQAQKTLFQNVDRIPPLKPFELSVALTPQLERMLQIPIQEALLFCRFRVMSLQNGRKSDIYQKMLEEDKPLQKQSLGGLGSINHNHYDYVQGQDQPNFELPTKLDHIRSEEKASKMTHTCKCYIKCEWDSCSCLQAKNQLCLQDQCCQDCIARKNTLLLDIASKVEAQEKVFCTCKKTKCNKKYCSCFAAGIMCGDKCSCEGCINCPRKSEHAIEIEEQDSLTIEQLAEMQMPKHMEFYPFTYNQQFG